jgi:hypothetical protein
VINANFALLVIFGALVLGTFASGSRAAVILPMLWCLGALAIAQQNQEKTVPIIALLMLALSLSSMANHGQRWALRMSVAALAFFMLLDTASIAWELAESHGAVPLRTDIDVLGDGKFIVDARFDRARNAAFLESSAGKNLIAIDDRDLLNADGALQTAAGISLLRRQIGPTDRVASLTFSNVFPVASRTESPRGVIQWLDTNRTWSPKNPDFSRLVGDATVIMQPAFAFDWPNARALIDATTPFLNRGWHVTARTPLWTVWRRNNAS